MHVKGPHGQESKNSTPLISQIRSTLPIIISHSSSGTTYPASSSLNASLLYLNVRSKALRSDVVLSSNVSHPSARIEAPHAKFVGLRHPISQLVEYTLLF
jgi:hypothetical protein